VNNSRVFYLIELKLEAYHVAIKQKGSFYRFKEQPIPQLDLKLKI